MDSLTEQLTCYASGLAYSDLPPEVVDTTRRIILDSVGCALGAARAGHHLGHYRNPMSDTDQDEKLRAMARDYAGLPDSRIDRLLERLRRLEQVEDVGAVLVLTAAE